MEDAMELPCITNAWKFHDELTEEDDSEEKWKNSEGLFFKCFFCRFFTRGCRGKNLCIAHMNSIHSFNYNEAFRNMEEENIKKAINYIRTLTDFGKCFVCEKFYSKQVYLEDHRILEEHINLPSMNVFASERWKNNSMPNDGFQINVQRR